MRIKIDIDYNGLVFFDPITVQKVDEGARQGVNLLKRYTELDIGDDVLREGAFVPILAIDAATYILNIEVGDPPKNLGMDDVVANSNYALKVMEKAFVADLDALMDWRGQTSGWVELGISPGDYRVSIIGFRSCSSEELIEAGYKVFFSKVESLPEITADTGKNMRVNYPFGDTAES